MTLDRRRTDALIGTIVVLVLAAVTVVGVRGALGEFSDEYTLTASTTRTGFGLDTASAVKIRGISVGRVESVELLDDGTVSLTMAIRHGVTIPASASASIEPVSVFGPKFVKIVPGSGESSGPFLADGDSLGAIVAPSELTETLDSVSVLLEVVDPAEVGILLTELARGLDGNGEQLGETIDASADLIERLDRVRPQLETLVVDAAALADELADHADALATISAHGGPVLDLLASRNDPLGALLVQTSELAVRVDDLLRTSGGELSGVVIGLEGGASVLAEHIVLISDFVDGLDQVSSFLGEGLLAWERAPGVYGGIGHGFLDFDPCYALSLDAEGTCPTGGGQGG